MKGPNKTLNHKKWDAWHGMRVASSTIIQMFGIPIPTLISNILLPRLFA